MKGVLIFNLLKEREEFVLAQQGPSYAAAASEFRNFLRGLLKHRELSGDEYAMAQEIESKFFEVFEGLET